MAEYPLVSAIIATYNRKHYVCEAIDSVFNQTYPNVELIVIDDGSTDGTGDLLQEKYGDQVHYIYQNNQGRSEARNHGMQLAKGEYIAFLDSDDMWKSNKLTIQVTFMEKHPEYGLTHTFKDDFRYDDVTYMDLNHSRWLHNQYLRAIKLGYIYLTMSRRCLMFWSTVAVRSNVATQIGKLDKTCETYEDWDWYLRASLITKIGTVKESLTWYRNHEDNSTIEQFLNGQIILAHKHLKQADQLPDSIRRQAKRNFYIQLATVAYYRENVTECRRWLWQALRVDPTLIVLPYNWSLLMTALMPSQISLKAREMRRRLPIIGNKT